MSLIQEYTRATENSHFHDRWKERVQNVQLSFPASFFLPEDDRDTRQLIHSLVLAEIKRILEERYSDVVQNGKPEDPGVEYITLLAGFNLRRDSKSSPVQPILLGEKDKADYAGSVFYALSHNNSWITLKIYSKNLADPTTVIQDSIRHIKKYQKRIVTSDNFEHRKLPQPFPTIEIDKLLDAHQNPPEPVITGPKSPDDLPYQVKTEWRFRPDRSTYFTHDNYGKGLVIASRDGGAMNIGRGKWEYVKVKFPGDTKPFREFNSLYTSVYFNHRTESRVRNLLTKLFEQVS